jgi:iron complex outermembrane recepter protein
VGRLGLVAATAVASALMVQGVRAEDQPSASISEVVVTGARSDTQASAGTKSDTPLVETPQSITVVDRSQLDLLNVTELNEALRYVAGVSPDTRGSTGTRYDLLNLRGFTPDQYLDGLKLIQSANGYAVPQVDVTRLDRIEVVKGPASVLYGQASPGGIVALSSKLPTANSFGQLEVLGGSFGTAQVDADLGGPLDRDGRVLFRVDGVLSRTDTEIAHTEAQRVAISPALTLKPDAKTSWTLLYAYQRDPKGGAYGDDPTQGSLLPNPNGRIAEDFNSGEPGFERYERLQNSFTSLFTRELWDGWTFRQNARFLRLTSYYQSVYSFTIDPGLATIPRFADFAQEGINNLTLDTQVAGSLHTGPVTHAILVGTDYQHTSQNEASGFSGAASDLNIFNPVYGLPVTPSPETTFTRLNQNQTGVYLQDALALDRFRLMLSGRYDWVDQSEYAEDRSTPGVVNKSTAPLDKSKFTGRAGLLYLFDFGLAPYASYSTSFQPQTTTSVDGGVLPPTEGKQAEVGVKYQPKVWDTLVTLSLYDLRETNVATQDPNAPIGFSIAAGEIRSKGLELEGHTHPLPNVQINLAYTYLDNLVTKDNSGLQGTRPYGVPQQTASAYGVYSWQTGWLAGAGLGGGVRYLGQSFNGEAGAGQERVPPATLFDLIATYDFSRVNPALKGLSLDVNVRNLFNARYISSCYSTYWCWYGDRQDAQAALRYRW